MKKLKFDELVLESGFPARTIRFYITRGLIQHPSRAGGKAVYGSEHLEALREIQRLQRQGLTLAEIRQQLQPDVLEAPAPVRWDSYEVAQDVVVMVRGEATGSRLRQVRNALLALSASLKGDQGRNPE